MLYRIICPVLRFLKRFPHLLPLSLLALVLLTFGSLLYAKIYQRWDKDPDRGAIAISGGAYGESYSTPRYLELDPQRQPLVLQHQPRVGADAL